MLPIPEDINLFTEQQQQHRTDPLTPLEVNALQGGLPGVFLEAQLKTKRLLGPGDPDIAKVSGLLCQVKEN